MEEAIKDIYQVDGDMRFTKLAVMGNKVLTTGYIKHSEGIFFCRRNRNILN